MEHENFWNKRKFFILSLIIFSFMIGLIGFRLPNISSDSKKRISEFELEYKGVLIHKKELDHNDAFCKLIIIESNKDFFDGKDYLDRNLIIRNDTVFMTLMRSDCIKVGDTIQFGPNDNYSIKNVHTFFDRHLNIDYCYKRDIE